MRLLLFLIRSMVCVAGNTLMILTRQNLGLHQYSFHALDAQNDTQNHFLDLGIKWAFPLSSVLLIGAFSIVQMMVEPNRSVFPFIILLIMCPIAGLRYLANSELNYPENNDYDTMGINTVVQKILGQKNIPPGDLERQSNLFEIALWINTGLIALLFEWFTLSIFFFLCSGSIAVLSLNRRQIKRRKEIDVHLSKVKDQKIQDIIKGHKQKPNTPSTHEHEQAQKPVATLIKHHS